ncbi:predicted protein [Plenodomus lingam JN3]|uniref:Predicted protein n=1 Tax=Leptosphaeria maculans (strain JN3 / isolate v23.1.3 / race Av1-4-5-6-7-8) TaxID=985895 RepID=E4ZZH0_LEPMJ|nr:predicted protein [Plenodomus lingam JN3]CBX96765.1 predicted protein [Plenodomus lingam JN3]
MAIIFPCGLSARKQPKHVLKTKLSTCVLIKFLNVMPTRYRNLGHPDKANVASIWIGIIRYYKNLGSFYMMSDVAIGNGAGTMRTYVFMIIPPTTFLKTITSISPKCPRLPDYVSQYHSALDISHGPLRTTSDGNLIVEESGDWVLLDTPPHDRQNHEIKVSRRNIPAIDLPEAKNGATGLEDARSRDRARRIIKDRGLVLA